MYMPVADDEIPAIVALINRAYRGNTGSGWSTKEAYLEGDRTTEAQLEGDLARKPAAFLLKWHEYQGNSISGCVWLEPLDGRPGILAPSQSIRESRMAVLAKRCFWRRKIGRASGEPPA